MIKLNYMKRMKLQKQNLKNATMDLKGAHCASCAYTIEHLGRKIQGVEDILVNAGKQEIYVTYDGDTSSLEKISEVIQRLGYSAAVRRK